MINSLRDPIWQFIGAALALIAILVSVWLYRRNRQTKALACEFDPVVSPIEIKAGTALEGDIEIRYKEQEVGNLFLVRARLKNTGSFPIRGSDVVQPVTFIFGAGTELLREPQVVHRKPENLQIAWHWPEQDPDSKRNAVELGLELLNPGEELTAQFVCTGEGGTPTVTARIEGITRIELLDPEDIRLRQEASLSLFFIALFAGMGLLAWLLARTAELIERLVQVPKSVSDVLIPLGNALFVALAFLLLYWLIAHPIARLMLYRWRKRRG
jgi:hypothetical protein